MADEIVAMQLRMSADLRRFEKSMDAMRATADRRLNEVERRALQSQKNLSRTMDNTGKGMVASLRQSLSGMAPMLAATFSVAAITKMADSWTDMTGRMRLAVDEGQDVGDAMERIADMAVRTYSALDTTAEGFFRNAGTMRELGYSTDQTLDYVEALNNALVVSGAKGQRAESVMNALSKAMAKGRLDGDNLNTVIESGGRVAQVIAERLGVTTLQLAKLGKEGKITGAVLYDALAGNLTQLRTEADRMAATVGDALQNLQTKIVQYVGQADQSLGATEKMAEAIKAVGDNLDLVTKIIGVLVAVMGTKYVLALTAAASSTLAATVASVRYQAALVGLAARQGGVTAATVLATSATSAFSAALMANPIGAVIVATAALSAGLYFLAQRTGQAEVAKRKLDAVVAAADTTTQQYSKALADAATKTGEEREEALKLAAAIRETSQARIADIRLTAQQRATEAAAARSEVARLRAERAASNEATPMWRRGPNQARTNQTLGLSAAEAVLGRAETAANEAFDAVKAAEAALATADAPIIARPPSAPSEDGKKGNKASGPTPEELARQRQILDLQAEIALLRAQDRGAEADARQDVLDVLNLTKQYADAGFANAEAKAAAQVQALALAREANRQAEEAKEIAEGEARALDMMRGFAVEILGVQEQLALTDRSALDVRRQILAIRQAERRAALEAAAADQSSTEAERAAARSVLAGLGGLEAGERQELDSSSQGARMAQDVARNLNPYANAVEQAREAYAEIDRLRQEDALSEAEAAQAKKQIDNDLREQRLAGTRSMLDTLATLQNSSNKKLAALGKAAAIAQATIDGVLAVQKALASAPPPMNFVQAAIVGAVAAANVASIAGMADGGMVGGSGGPRQDNQLRWLSTGEFVNNSASVRKNRPFLEAANNGADLSKLIPGLAGGGLVGRATAAAGAVASAPRSVSTSSYAYSPTIDARGADSAAVARLERILEAERLNFAANVNGVRERRARYRIRGRS